VSDDIRRRPTGQFQKGTSGNPQGARRRQPVPLLTREDLARTILKVASGKVTLSSGEKINRLEANVRSLATGAAKNRLSCKDFIALVSNAVGSMDEINRRREKDREEEERRRLRAARGY
jgi:hypothetical protein